MSKTRSALAGADYLVVGAGSSGAVITRRLLDAGKTVILLEAGPQTPLDSAAVQAVRNGNQPAVLPGLNWKLQARIRGDATGRGSGGGSVYSFEGGRVVGGSSAINATLACRGNPRDYDGWAQTCGSEWSFAELLPFFKKLEDDPLGPSELHGRGGPFPVRRESEQALRPLQAGFLAACRERGYADCVDHNSPDTSGVGPFPKNVVDGERISTKRAYLDPVLEHAGMRLVTNAHVRRLIWKTDASVAGVEVSIAGELQPLFAERIVICGGVMNTPQILQRSGVGNPNLLRPLGVDVRLALPGVGEGLMDHPVVGIWGVPTPAACQLGEPARQILLRYTSRHASGPNDMHLCMMGGIDVAELFPKLAATSRATTLGGLLVVNNGSHSRGHVRISSTDPAHPPDILINCLADPTDAPPLAEGVRIAWDMLQSSQLRPHFHELLAWTDGVVRSDVALAQAVRTFVRPAAHLGCTARMGRSIDDGAVVDCGGRMHGCDNVWIADMSIAPTIPSSPPHLTCLMIAEKIAAHLLAMP